MRELFIWVFNSRYNKWGIITEHNVGRYKSETSVYYPELSAAHDGNGFSNLNYDGGHLLYYTEVLLRSRTTPATTKN